MMSRRRFLVCTASCASAVPLILRGETVAVCRLGLVADVQYADRDPWHTRYCRNSVGKLREAVERFNRLELEGWVNLGDLIDRDWGSFEPVLEAVGRSRHGVYHVLGNHDLEVPDAFKRRVAKRLGLKRRYYTVWRGGFCLIVLDTNEVSVYAQPSAAQETAAAKAMLERLKTTGAVNAQTWNGAVGARQLSWFERTCQQAERRNCQVIVFAHHPVFPDNAHNAWNTGELLGVMQRQRNVVAWINGHNHQGAYGVYDGVPCITLKGMVETEGKNAFATVQLHADRLELSGYGREESREVLFRKTA